ncbi:MAG: FAD-dependent oxidoreductase [Candidatus Cloacimonetes bacterium]|nr:FAD-dependent oxidoreductase [Candidatus Cloacimonadota bacterium]
MAKRILVIGGAAAGPKTAAKARRLDETAEITLIQKGSYMSMASCGYPYYIGGVFDEREKLVCTPTGAPRDEVFFRNVKNVNARTNTEAIDIDPKRKLVTVRSLESGETEELPYDKLMLAVGASPIRPPIPGIDLDNVTTLHNIDDATFIKEKVKSGSVKQAVIIGGGLIGIETAEAFALAGIKVTVVEMLPYILPFLDPEMALIVQNHLWQKGATVLTGVAAEAFTGDDAVNGVRLSNGDVLPADFVVVSIGVKPNNDLAKKAGLKLGVKGAICVNRFMQTSDPDIFSAGDCVEVTDLVTYNKIHWPMGDAANLQGRVAAQNMIEGNRAEYEGAVMTGVCKVFDYSVGSVGLSETRARAEGYSDIITAIHAAPDKPGFMSGKLLIIKLVADRSTGRLLGMQAAGPGDVSKRLGVAAMALHNGMHVHQLVNLDLPYAPPFSQALDSFITAVHVLENKLLGRMTGISSLDFKAMLDRGEKPFMLDARGADEYAQMRIGVGETLIPLGKLRGAKSQLPADTDALIITWCKISLRGYEAQCILRGMGYNNVLVLEGGLMAWPFGLQK